MAESYRKALVDALGVEWRDRALALSMTKRTSVPLLPRHLMSSNNRWVSKPLIKQYQRYYKHFVNLEKVQELVYRL